VKFRNENVAAFIIAVISLVLIAILMILFTCHVLDACCLILLSVLKSGKPNLKCIVRGRREKEGAD
jgi:hypothetical protein